MSRHHQTLSLRWFTAIIAAITVGGLASLIAHNGSTLPASINNAPGITIDGQRLAGETAWGTGNPAGLSPNTCTEFTAENGNPVTFFATKDTANLYLSMTIPDSSQQAEDRLLLFFDPDHSANANLDKDVLFDLPFGTGVAPDVTNRTMSTGNGTTWTPSATFPAGVEVKYSRNAAGIVFEMKIPFTTFSPTPSQLAATGFAFVYLNQTAIDPASDPTCAGIAVPPGELLAFKVAFPSTLPVGASLPASVNHAAAWGDIGKDTAAVKFTTPVCCSNPDVNFPDFASTTFPGNTDVKIRALVHPHNMFDAKKVNVQIIVHEFGTGGTDICNCGLPAAVDVPNNAPASGTPVGPVTWHTPPSGPTKFHACVETIILPPTGADDYSIAGMNTHAQRNVDVAAVAKGMISQLQFVTFNPDTTTAQTIRLVSQQRGPRLDGLRFELVQPDGPLGPRQQARVALVVNAAADVPTTDVPRQTVHVPPTAGRKDAVALQVNIGDRLYFTATGAVDIDAGGNAPSAGPDGVDVSEVVRGQFLFSNESASRFGGGLIGSFDGFETSFLLGANATITVPERNQGLRLAINDLVEGNTDNTGRGFDVEAWTMGAGAPQIPVGAVPAVASSEPPFPEVHIVATSVQQVRLDGVAKPYNIVNNLGAVTYQILVTDQGAPGGGPSYWLWLLLLLILLAIIALFVWKKRQTV